MTLISALNGAMSGLRASQAGIDVVSRNVANAGTAGYTRKVLPRESATLGGDGAGVRTLAVRRELDLRLQSALFVQRSVANRFAVAGGFLTRLDQMFGKPDDDASVAAKVKQLTGSLQELADAPESAAVRNSVLAAAGHLARDLNRLTDAVQGMRLEAEQGIARSVAAVNDALGHIHRLNAEIAARSVAGQATADLEDQRDLHLSRLSEEMGVTVIRGESDRIAVFTLSGRTLVDGGVNELVFEPASAITAGSTRENGLVGRIVLSNTGEDLVARNEIRTGNIAGHLAIRDDVMPQAQAQLDELAHALALSLSATSHSVAADAGSAAIDVTDIGRPGDRLVIDYQDPSQTPALRQLVLTGVDSAAPGPGEFSTIGTDDDVIASIGAALAPLTFSSTPGSRSMTVTATAPLRIAGVRSFTEAGLGLALFKDGIVDGQIAYEDLKAANFTAVPGRDQKVGFAGRIAVSKALLADPGGLVRYKARPEGADSLATLATAENGANGRALDLIERLAQRPFAFDAATGIGGARNPYEGPVESFAIQIVSFQAMQTADLNDQATAEVTYRQMLEQRFDAGAGVDVDDELAQLILLQNSYGASARVISTVQAMLDELMGIAR